MVGYFWQVGWVDMFVVEQQFVVDFVGDYLQVMGYVQFGQGFLGGLWQVGVGWVVWVVQCYCVCVWGDQCGDFFGLYVEVIFGVYWYWYYLCVIGVEYCFVGNVYWFGDYYFVVWIQQVLYYCVQCVLGVCQYYYLFCVYCLVVVLLVVFGDVLVQGVFVVYVGVVGVVGQQVVDGCLDDGCWGIEVGVVD